MDNLYIVFFVLLIVSTPIVFNIIKKLKKENNLLKYKLRETFKKSEKELRENVEEKTREINKINIMLMDRAIELGSINQITDKVTLSLNLDDIFQSACNELIKIFPIKNAITATLDDRKKKLIVVAINSVYKNEYISLETEIDLNENGKIEEVIKSKQVFQIEKVTLNHNKVDNLKIKENNILNNVLAVPIVFYMETIGIIILPANEVNYNFSQPEIDLAKAVAEKISNSIRNAKLYSKTENALNIATNDLEIGKEIQSGFFPDKIEAVKGVEIYAYFKAARQVSGDFYDVFKINNSKFTLFVIADVCDKGVGAALFMVVFRSLLRAYSNNINEIIDIKEYLKNIILKTNNYIAQTHQRSNMFASIFIGILNPELFEITYINCGLDAPFVINSEGKIINRLLPTGPVVGMFPDMEYKVNSINLNKGDILFAYTDGTTEAKNVEHKLFTEELLINTISAPWVSGFSMLYNLNSILKKHMGTQEQYDDITQLIIRRKFSQEEIKHSIVCEAKLDNLQKLRDFVETAALHSELTKEIAFAFKIATEEACTNIINHGYEGRNEGNIEIEFNIENNNAILKILDSGKYFSPDEVEIPNINSNLEERRIGGLGLAIIKGLMDGIHYNKVLDNRHQLILEKKIN